MVDLLTWLLESIFDWYFGASILVAAGLGLALTYGCHLPAWIAWPLAIGVVILYKVYAYLTRS